ncbi:MAG: blue (type 1) copper domain protein [Gemmatimonadetes bacterium]|nr:blue (type 1) copper domain protein [Gemmatimonadota bacterium]
MRFYGIALLTGAALMSACGGEKKATDSAAAAPAASTTPAATTTPAAAAPAAGAAAAAPITGKTVEVKMIGDATGYKFEPATITIKKGDGVKFIMVSGGPHNVAFQNVADAGASAQLDANMPGTDKLGPLSSHLLSAPNESYVVSFGNVAAGSYDYICTPHAAMNMKGTIKVE